MSGLAHANVCIGAVAAPLALTPPLIYEQLNTPSSAGGNKDQFMGTVVKAPFAGTNIQWSTELRKIGTPTGNFTAKLYSCNVGSYVPNVDLGSAAETYSYASAPTSYSGSLVHTFNWSGLSILSGRNYAVVIYNDGSPTFGGSDYQHLGRELQSVNGIVDAYQVFWGGTSWNVLTSWETTGTVELWT